MTVRCLFFARYSELLGCEACEVRLPHGSNVSDVVEEVRRRLPGGQALPRQPLVAKNQKHVKLDAAVEGGDEVAFLPPLAGG
jgi:molybdopterin synthase sulfur carrier subunit